MGFELTTLVVIGTDCKGSNKSNYHTIRTTTVPCYKWNAKPTLITGTLGLNLDDSWFKTSPNNCWCFDVFLIFIIRTMAACKWKQINTKLFLAKNSYYTYQAPVPQNLRIYLSLRIFSNKEILKFYWLRTQIWAKKVCSAKKKLYGIGTRTELFEILLKLGLMFQSSL